MNTKKIIILKHGGGELANQLWNYVSIWAYGLEVGAPVRNPSFYEYHYFFRFLKNESCVTNITSRLMFRRPRRRSNWINRNQRFKYAQRAWITEKFHPRCVFSSETNENKPTLLPPSHPLPPRYESCNRLYFKGWLFRNPAGLSKYGKELRTAFAPSDTVLKRVDEIIAPLRAKYEKIIGIHIRQGDYKTFKGGKYLISQERIREIVSEYAKENILDAAKTAFIIASDGPVDESLYKKLNVHVSKENAVTDLFLLSKCDAIIGSDSSFGAFAAWFGNIPHVICKQGPMDWAYYADKTEYFDNKLSELRHY
ncbi:MAG TPA: alpha-1,2-fucosyltransferase [Candidatus Paceibacterota bacterium]|nr:alpha-1,2-fucosyltransferase [Candidatus Paceibacterota bacterium]